MDCRYKVRWEPDFVVTGELLDARVISDRLSLSIEDSASTFLWQLNRIEPTKNWRHSSSACNLFCRRSLPALVHANCDGTIVTYISSGLKWAEHTRVEPSFIWKIRLNPKIISK